MTFFEKGQTFFILVSVGLGLLAGQHETIAKHAAFFITPALVAMLFGLFLGIALNDLKKSFLDKKFALTSLGVNFIWVPILAWLLGNFFLADNNALRIGFIMLLVTPCTDWYLVFTGIANGNIALSAAILPLNLIVQILLLPVYLLLFAGMAGYVDIHLILKSVVLVLFLPFVLALLVNAGAFAIRPFLVKVFAKGQNFFLYFAIAAMFASQANQLVKHLNIFLLIFPPVIMFFIINFLVGRMLGKMLKFSYADSVSLSLTTLARNSPVALAIAVTAFPDKPLIALALIIGPLIELPVLAVISHILKRSRKPSRPSYSDRT